MAIIQGGALTTRLAFGGAIAAVLAVVGYVVWVQAVDEQGAPQDSVTEAPASQTTAPEESLAEEGALAGAANLPELAVDIFRSDASGATLIAGTATPGSTIQIALDGASHSTATATGGEYVAMFEIIPNGDERLIEIAAYDAAGKQLTKARSFIVAPRNVQSAALDASNSAPTVTPMTTDQQAETSGDPARAAALQGASAQGVAQDTTATTATQTTQPEATAAPDVLVASSEGIRVLQSGGGPDVQAQVVIDTITYDPAGDVELAGRAPANGTVRVYLNNAPIKTTKIAPDGQWKAPLPKIDAGVYTLRVDELGADGSVASRTETPFQREDPEALANLATAQNQSTGQAGTKQDQPANGIKVTRLTVQPGNTLWGLASEAYGDGMLFVRLFEANKDTIRNPDLIYPGQVFALPSE